MYLWRDRQAKRFYLGSHYGAIDDGYICGSKRMLREYAKRPQDFRRRVVQRLARATRREVLRAEQSWLDCIRPDELDGRYYNVSRRALGADPERARVWMIGNKNGLGHPCSPEKAKKISEAQKGKVIPLDVRVKFSVSGRGNLWFTNGIANTRAKTSPGFGWRRGRTLRPEASNLGRKHDRAFGERVSTSKREKNALLKAMFGYVHSQTTRDKISRSQKARLAAHSQASKTT